MKSTFGLLCFCITICSIFSYPTTTKSPDNDAEVIVIPLVKHNPFIHDFDSQFDDFDGIIDTGYQYPSTFSSFNPYNWGFMNRLQDILRRFREQSFGWPSAFGPTSFQPISPGIDAVWSEAKDKGNTTSKVEIINGHKVVVNETVYKKHGDFGESIYKVRVVNVVPNDQDNTEKTTTNDHDFDKQNHHNNNNNNNNNKNNNNNDKTTINPYDKKHINIDADIDKVIGTKDKPDDVSTRIDANVGGHHAHIPDKKREEIDDIDNLDNFKGSPETLDTDNIESNEIWKDVEELSEFDNNFQHELQDNLLEQNTNGPIEIDLSNDILVNDEFVDQNIYNPDAEIFDVENFQNHENYEKLTVEDNTEATTPTVLKQFDIQFDSVPETERTTTLVMENVNNENLHNNTTVQIPEEYHKDFDKLKEFVNNNK